MNVTRLKDDELAQLIVDVVRCQNLNRLDITVHVYLALLKDLVHLDLSIFLDLYGHASSYSREVMNECLKSSRKENTALYA